MGTQFIKCYSDFDPDALTYIRAVELADGAALESTAIQAIDSFVRGCKSDNIWNAIKSCCILSVARTLAGCLVPLKGTAPTNYNFVAGDYSRSRGLTGNGVNKYLDTNRNNNQEPQNNQHLAIGLIVSQSDVAQRFLGGGGGNTGASVLSRSGFGGALGPQVLVRSRNSSGHLSTLSMARGPRYFFGKARSTSTGFTLALNNQESVVSMTSQVPSNGNITVFQSLGAFANDTIYFYSIGESINLQLLRQRLSTLISTINLL